MKKRLISVIAFMLCLFISAGCDYFYIKPYNESDYAHIVPLSTPEPTPVPDYSYKGSTYIDKDFILDTVRNSADEVYTGDRNGYCYIFNRMILSQYADTDIKKEIVLGLYAAMLTSQENYYFPEGTDMNADELNFLMNLLDGEAPELFNVDDEYKYYTSDKKVVRVKLSYTVTPDRFAEMLEEAFAFYDDVTVGKDITSDYDLELCLHDGICERCIYKKLSDNSKNAYGAISEGAAICEGYSDAFTLGMMYLGLPCCQLWGEAINNEGKSEAHAWNVAEIDGELYHVDITWDDAKEKEDSVMLYSYFNVTDEEISRNHFTDEELAAVFTTDCISSEYNYHTVNGLVLDEGIDCREYMIQKLNAVLSEGKTEGGFLIKFANEDDFTDMMDNTESIIHDWLQNEPTLESAKYNTLYDSVMRVLYFEIKLTKR